MPEQLRNPSKTRPSHLSARVALMEGVWMAGVPADRCEIHTAARLRRGKGSY